MESVSGGRKFYEIPQQPWSDWTNNNGSSATILGPGDEVARTKKHEAMMKMIREGLIDEVNFVSGL